jgi:hypothetical protein
MKTKHGSLVVLSLAAPLMLAMPILTSAVGCSSSPAGPPSNGGGGSGGTAATCPVVDTVDGSPVVDPNMISNFEDGMGSVLQQGNPPRNGGWYAYNDGLTGCMETPAAAPAGGTAPEPAATLIENGGRCGSLYAFRFFGSGCTSFAGAGTDLAAPLPTDGGTADAGTGTALKTPYDVSAFKAVQFYGRLGTTAMPSTKQQVQFKLPMTLDTKTTDGGLCLDSPTNKCSASYGNFFNFTSQWQLFTLMLDPTFKGTGNTLGIQQETWGAVFPWTPTDVTSIQVQAVASNPAFDIWVDDISFVAK